MGIENLKPSDKATVLGVIAPISQGVGTATSAWISVQNFAQIVALLQTGVLGSSATVDAKFQQATDGSGTSAKDITGAAITQIVKASGDGKQAFINLNPELMDSANGFSYVQLSMTVGTAASLIAAVVLGFSADLAPGSQAATVVQTIN